MERNIKLLLSVNVVARSGNITEQNTLMAQA